MGYDVYLPMLEGVALFPRYLFVNADGSDFYDLNRLPGGVGVVHFGNQPGYVLDDEIDELKSREWVESEDCAPGTKVCITAGPFNLYEGLVEAKANDRIYVWINWLGGKRKLDLPLKDVVAA